MVAQVVAAELAGSAGAIDLTDHPAAGQGAGAGHADKLMAENPPEAHVALAELQIGFADSGMGDIDDCLPRLSRAQCCRGSEMKPILVDDSPHGKPC